MNWDLTDDVKLTAIGSYTDITSQLTSDADASPINFQVTGGQQDFHWATAEVRLSGRASDRLDWTVGGFYYTGKATNRQAVSFPPIPFGATGILPVTRCSCIEAPPGRPIPIPFAVDCSTFRSTRENIADPKATQDSGTWCST